MDAKLSLHDDGRADEDIQELVFSLTRTLNQETDLTAGLPEETGGLGTKGDLGVVGQIILAALSSGTVVALLQVLKSYVERKPTLRIEIERPDGNKVTIAAEHLDPGQIEQTTRAVQQLCAASLISEPEPELKGPEPSPKKTNWWPVILGVSLLGVGVALYFLGQEYTVEVPQQGRTIGQYIDHGDGTITDKKTGLMWKRCPEGLSGDNCEEGEVETYMWNEAVERFKNVAYAGSTDWRLPTIDELKTLVYCSKGKNKYGGDWCNDGSEEPTINQQAFPNTETWAYWSGSPLANFSDYAWSVIFNGVISFAYNRNYSLAVRLVHGGQSPIKLQPLPKAEGMPQKDRTITQYIDHGDGTIIDMKTGLMWKRCLEGLSGDNCEEGKVETYTWDEAVERFKDVAYAGSTDWRLPTIDELQTLVYCSKGVADKENGRCNKGSEVPTINQQLFPNTEANVFWSGSPSANDSDFAWNVYFNDGFSVASGRNDGYAVRLVRGGQ